MFGRTPNNRKEQKMIVKLIFDAQFCGHIEEEVLMPDSATKDDIKAMFPKCLDIAYDENCTYEILSQSKKQ